MSTLLRTELCGCLGTSVHLLVTDSARDGSAVNWAGVSSHPQQGMGLDIPKPNLMPENKEAVLQLLLDEKKINM